MFISPHIAIQQGWLTWNTKVIPNIEKYIQPNAIDFDCASLYMLDDRSQAMLSEDRKVMRRIVEQNTIQHETYGNVWDLRSGMCYDFVSNFHVQLPAGVAADLIIRSTLNRCGLFLTSGLYDSGFNGHVAGVLRVCGGDFNLAPNTRIGQIRFIRSEDSGKLYEGGYNHPPGTHWSGNSDNSGNTIKQLEQSTVISADHTGSVAGQQSFV